MMAARKTKYGIAEISYAAGKWSTSTSETGITTNTSSAADASATNTILDDRPAQVHSNCPVGSKVTEIGSRVVIEIS
jgi:hypothetical protein